MKTLQRKYMQEAFIQAERGRDVGEVPVGAVVVRDGEVIGRGHNLTLSDADPTLHAEIVAMREACSAIGSRRLDGCSLYVTLEPCPMCAGAIVLARIERLIFGAYDAKMGACGTLYAITTDARLNHRVETLGGVMDEEAAELLRTFFRERRTSASP